jgi:two-component system cell cycle response regulator
MVGTVPHLKEKGNRPVETADRISVLLIEDDPEDARLVAEVLRYAENGRFLLETVPTLSEGLERLSEHTFHVVLLDLSPPDCFGVSAIDALLLHASEQPIIVLTSAKDERLALNAGQRGAQDFLVKSEIPGGVLPRSIVYAIERQQTESRLKRTVTALREANQKILEQQKSVIEEERLELLLQMAGTTSYELNQPLMTLLDSIDSLRREEKIPERFSRHIDRIDESGRRITKIATRMSTIQQVDPKTSAAGEAGATLDREIRILYVEDSDEDYELFEAHIERLDNIELTRAPKMATATAVLSAEKFDLIFADYLLPDGTGLDLLQWMRNHFLETPVISVTGYGDEVIATKMIQSGAYDYLPKSNVDHEALLRCICQALDKFNLKKMVEQSNVKMIEMATRDPLTGLLNRRSMNNILENEFNRARRYGTDLACLLMDLDFFKEVNDTYGHHFGDHVLQQFGQRLTQNLRDTDICFRYGGEEFVVLIPNAGNNEAQRTAEKIRQACESEKYDDGSYSTAVTVSLGVATVVHLNPSEARGLLTLADKALYRAKAEGRNRVVVYHEDLWKANTDKTYKYLQERLSGIIEKTKKASVKCLELMVWDRESDGFRAHNQRVKQYFDLIGEKLGFNQTMVKTLQNAAVFHDATKYLLGGINQKKYLDEGEMGYILDHPCRLHELIAPFDFFAGERSVLLRHHENWDGSGYPDGLHADEIPVGARIFAVVDAFVAMTSQRSYRRKFTTEEAVLELATYAGTQFDPVSVNAFIDAVKESAPLALSDEVVAAAKSKLAGLDALNGGAQANL